MGIQGVPLMCVSVATEDRESFNMALLCFEIPAKLMECVRQGMDLAQRVMGRITSDPHIGEHGGLIGILSMAE